MAPSRVVIVGCGFGGLWAAQALKRAPVELTVIDRTNHHLFTPLLYQVATAGLSAPSVAGPIRHILAHQRNTTVLYGEVSTIDPAARVVVMENGEQIPYDYLIVAAGTTHSYFGHDEWAPYAPGLKTLEDALEIRRRVLLAFEQAERERDPAKRAAWLTFVVVGGGATGVELAGTFAEIARPPPRRPPRPPHPARRIPPHRPAQRPRRTGRGRRSRAAALPARALRQGAARPRTPWRHGVARPPGHRNRCERRLAQRGAPGGQDRDLGRRGEKLTARRRSRRATRSRRPRQGGP